MMLTIILFAIGAMILVLALRSLRAGRLKERYVVLFALVGVPFVLLAIWPDAIGTLARRLEIQYPTVLLLCVTTFFLLMNFKLLSIVSMHEQRIATLAQLLAIVTNDGPEAGSTGRDASDGTTTPSSPRGDGG